MLWTLRFHDADGSILPQLKPFLISMFRSIYSSSIACVYFLNAAAHTTIQLFSWPKVPLNTKLQHQSISATFYVDLAHSFRYRSYLLPTPAPATRPGRICDHASIIIVWIWSHPMIIALGAADPQHFSELLTWGSQCVIITSNMISKAFVQVRNPTKFTRPSPITLITNL